MTTIIGKDPWIKEAPSASEAFEKEATMKDAKADATAARGDPRMNLSVQLKLQNPTLSLADALRNGGFSYPVKASGLTVDKEGVSLGQRKNQLNRRVRRAAAASSKSPEESSSSVDPSSPEPSRDLNEASRKRKAEEHSSDAPKATSLSQEILSFVSSRTPSSLPTPTITPAKKKIKGSSSSGPKIRKTKSKNSKKSAVRSFRPAMAPDDGALGAELSLVNDLLGCTPGTVTMFGSAPSTVTYPAFGAPKKAPSKKSIKTDHPKTTKKSDTSKTLSDIPTTPKPTCKSVETGVTEAPVSLFDLVTASSTTLAPKPRETNVAQDAAKTNHLFDLLPASRTASPSKLFDDEVLSLPSVDTQRSDTLAGILGKVSSESSTGLSLPSERGLSLPSDSDDDDSSHVSVLDAPLEVNLPSETSSDDSHSATSSSLPTPPVSSATVISNLPIHVPAAAAAPTQKEPEEDPRLALALHIFESELLSSAYQRAMSQAGFSPEESEGSSRLFHRFASLAWAQESRRLAGLFTSANRIKP